MNERFQVVPASYVVFLRAGADGDEVLLQLRRGTGYMDEHWACAAAGHIEEGESAFSAAVREATEELGVSILEADLEPVCAMHRTQGNGDPIDERADFFFAVRDWEGTPRIVEPAKCADLQWYPLGRMPCPLVPHEAVVLEALRDERQIPAVIASGFADPSPSTGPDAAATGHVPAPQPADDDAAWAAWLRTVPLTDGHNDLPISHRVLGGHDLEKLPLSVPQPRLCTDLPRLRAGGIGAQFWSVFVSASQPEPEAVLQTLDQIDFVRRFVAAYPDDLALATSVAEVLRAVAGGRIASLMGAEGGHQIGSSLGVLRRLYELGVRYLTLTHNKSTSWADSATDVARHDGLTSFGREVVAEMNGLGMLVDLSHVADATMSDALDVTRAPVIFSHSSARAVADVARNVPDPILGRLAVNGGVCMVTFVPEFISPAVVAWRRDLVEAAAIAGVGEDDYDAFVAFGRSFAVDVPKPEAMLGDVVAHIEHVREVAGVHHVGIGSDFDGCDSYPVGLADVAAYPGLFRELAARGWSTADLRALAGGNLLRVLGDAEQVASA